MVSPSYRVDTQGLLDRVFPLSTEPSMTPVRSCSFRTLLQESSEHPLRVLRVRIPFLLVPQALFRLIGRHPTLVPDIFSFEIPLFYARCPATPLLQLGTFSIGSSLPIYLPYLPRHRQSVFFYRYRPPSIPGQRFHATQPKSCLNCSPRTRKRCFE